MTELKLGRNRPPVDAPRLYFSAYARTLALPAAPAAVDYSVRPRTFLADILGNDKMGDCTIAGMLHIAGMVLANAGASIPSNFNTKLALAIYLSLTGGKDTGLDEVAVLDHWQKHGVVVAPGLLARIIGLFHKQAKDTHRIAGRISVNGADPAEVRAALWLFENLYFGVELPDAWVNPMPSASGFTWDVAGKPNPEQGHCFVGCSYDQDGVGIDSWGFLGKITYPAIAKYAATAGSGELYAVLSDDAINVATKMAPNGFAWDQLVADLGSVK